MKTVEGITSGGIRHRIECYRKKVSKKNSSFYLGVDVGGTNTNIGVSEIMNGKLVLLFSLHFKSRELGSLVPAVDEALRYARGEYEISVSEACVAAAGPVTAKHDSCKPTNLSWSINAKEILSKTGLDSVFVLNDFEAIGYGVNLLDVKNMRDVYRVGRGRRRTKVNGNPTKAIIGAGTGFGKNILFFDKKSGAYVPVPSEGGHADFPVQDEFELGLLDYIKETKKIGRASFEDVLSGSGLELIYFFLRESKIFRRTKYTSIIEESTNRPPLISEYMGVDGACRETFRLYSRFYGRCARNFVLETLAIGGVYVGGGIASKNKEIFNTRDFLDEFENSKKQSKILKDTPVYVIVNYNVSIIGACLAAHNRKDIALIKRWYR